MSAASEATTLPSNVFVENILAGSMNTILSGMLAVFQGTTLLVFATDRVLFSNPSYIIMLNLTIADLLQLAFHILSGFFIIFQTTFHFWIAKVSGALINSGCVAYTQMTMLLAINRFVVICCSQRFQFLFTTHTVKLWIFCVWLVGMLFGCAYLSPFVSVLFAPSEYKWGVVGEESVLLGQLEYYSAFTAIAVTLTAYILIAVKLVTNRQNGTVGSGRRTNEMRILLQAVIISAIVVLLQYTWYHYETFITPTKWVFLLINLLWIVACGINPVLYFSLNKTFRGKICQLLGLRQRSGSVPNRVQPFEPTKCDKVMNPISVAQQNTDSVGSAMRRTESVLISVPVKGKNVIPFGRTTHMSMCIR